VGAFFSAITGSAMGELQQALGGMPTKDPALNTTVGVAAKGPLKDDTDPQLTEQQRGKLIDKNAQLHEAGQEDAAQAMGEDQIYPDVPPETLRAKVPGGPGPAVAAPKAPAAGPAAGPVPPVALSAIATQERGPQIQAGFADGQGKMAVERQNKDTQT